MTTADDELDWDRARHGRMADYATDDDAVQTLSLEEYQATPRISGALTAGRVVGLADHLTRRGLATEVVAGADTRGAATLYPRGGVAHWTAGPKTGDRPSLHVCIYGRSDLPGPLCHVFLTRAGTCVVVATGRANHAGAGGWKGITGNSSVFGVEAEDDGDGRWTDAQRAVYPLLMAALAELGGYSWNMICGHNEWAPTRKVDIGSWSARLREEAAAVWLLDRPTITALQLRLGVPTDGVWGPNTIAAAQTWLGRPVSPTWSPDDARALQARIGATADGVLGADSTRSLTTHLTNTSQEDDMPTPKELTDHFETVAPGWGWGPRNAASADRKLTEVLALLAAVQTALSQGDQRDLDAIKAAVAEVLGAHAEQMTAIVESLQATVDGLVDRIDAEARKALTDALDRAREAVQA